jgi:hypothetical protein
MWKEAAVTYFKVLSQHLHGGTEDDHEITVRISGLRTEFRELPNTSANHLNATFVSIRSFRDVADLPIMGILYVLGVAYQDPHWRP